ncbi:PREDICTED: protein TIFY 11A-like [Tarenaya hassleriana]|uniref:protein TIFY 11A-like n=1 Tax=Tarenaya hassleriana TaxID=28532 RepID=UPI00053C5252|nr:PREDICTED: protein TIFY 11A-like [Tarenaya hassleriana]
MSKNATEKAPEKSNFARKCNLLSRYLKQNGSFRGIDLGLTRKPDSDLGLTGKRKPTGQENAMRKPETREIKTIDFIQTCRDAVPSASSGAKPNVAEPSEPEPGTSPLTIFFSGKVIVFDEFPADKAKEIMEIAKLANPETISNLPFGSESAADDDDNNYNSKMDYLKNDDDNNSKSNVAIPDLNEPTSSGNPNNNQTIQKNQLVERIARRASLHRFFAKRKDRAAARAPYQVNQNAGHHPPKPEMASSSLERGQSSGQENNNAKGHEDMLLEEEKEEEEEGQCVKDLELRL